MTKSKIGIYGNQLSKFQQENNWDDEVLRECCKMAGKYPIQEIAKVSKKSKRATAQKLARHGYSWKHPDNEELAA